MTELTVLLAATKPILLTAAAVSVLFGVAQTATALNRGEGSGVSPGAGAAALLGAGLLLVLATLGPAMFSPGAGPLSAEQQAPAVQPGPTLNQAQAALKRQYPALNEQQVFWEVQPDQVNYTFSAEGETYKGSCQQRGDATECRDQMDGNISLLALLGLLVALALLKVNTGTRSQAYERANHLLPGSTFYEHNLNCPATVSSLS